MEKFVWKLDNLFKDRFSFYEEMTSIRDELRKFNINKKIKVDGKNLYSLMRKCFSIRERSYYVLLYGSLNYYKDVNNESFINMKRQAEELDSFVNEETYFIDELLNLIDEDKLEIFYNEYPRLEKYRYYISNSRKYKNHMNNNCFNLVNDINSLINEYNSLFVNMDFGNSINNRNVNGLLVDLDRDVRKDTYLSMNNSYKDMEYKYYEILKSIVNKRKEISKLENYSSVLDKELYSNDINVFLIDNLIKSVNDNINIMNRYLRLKMNYLNIDNPSFYDINLSFKNDRVFDLETGIDIINNSLSILGKRYLDNLNDLYNSYYFDLLEDDKKHTSIVFSWNTYSFMNYRNKYNDLKNLIHESGHVMNSYLSLKKQDFIYFDSSFFCGEVASLVNEILLNDYLYKNSQNKEEKIFYLSKNIENFISQVYRQTMYTEFEKYLYNELDDKVSNKYLELVDKYYGNVLYYDSSVKYEWMRVGHIFRHSFYLYKYSIGYILAFNIVKKIKNGTIKSNYLNYLSSGSSMNNVDLLKLVDIDLNDENIMNDSFKLLSSYVDELSKLLED